VYVRLNNFNEVASAIKNLVVRGAPAIGVTAAFGLALAASQSSSNLDTLMKELEIAHNNLRSTRPTAVNLSWALERVMTKAKEQSSVEEVKRVVLEEALRMSEEDIEINKRIGIYGSQLIGNEDVVLTHCNAGSLATVGYGTALGVIRAANQCGKRVSVIATETRPVMQGSRLTAFELHHDGIEVSLIPDTAVGHTIASRKVKCVIVGADRVLRHGHVFNKIGTYQVALIANQHKIPFYVAAPLSTFDFKNNPSDIAIEERPSEEVTQIGGVRIVPYGVRVLNPAFDLTPPELISGFVTEKGVLRPPFERSIRTICQQKMS
jgi:methylthioribose-1-phosphate isomerase